MNESLMEKDKTNRVLAISTKLLNGAVVSKPEEAVYFHVNERSIQRDIDDIRYFLEETDDTVSAYNTVVNDRTAKGYRLEHIDRVKLSNSEVLAICKILLDSRAFTKKEMKSMLDRLISNCVPKSNQKRVSELIKNEEFHYVEPRHKKIFLDTLWEVGRAVYESRWIEVDYGRLKDRKVVHRRLKPVAIMFSEFYFYIAAFIEDEATKQDFDVLNDSFPTIYRIDRIKKLTVQEERFHIPYASRFEEGEFRKRIQFMFGGKLRKIRLRFPCRT